MDSKPYQRMEIHPISCVPERMIADSVVNDSTIVSVGQEVGTEVTFDATDSYINNNWEFGN